VPTKITEKWLTGQEVMDSYGLKQHELSELVSTERLTAFDYRNRRPYWNDEKLDELARKAVLFGLEYHYVKDYSEIYDDLPLSLFATDAVRSLAKELGLSRRKIAVRTPSDPLTSSEHRDLGQLRTEKEKWDDSIRAAVVATQYCVSQGRAVTRHEIWDELIKHRLDKIPDTTFEKIWKAIPQKYRHVGGRPRKAK
jgi:hypothetical protein